MSSSRQSSFASLADKLEAYAAQASGLAQPCLLFASQEQNVLASKLRFVHRLCPFCVKSVEETELSEGVE